MRTIGSFFLGIMLMIPLIIMVRRRRQRKERWFYIIAGVVETLIGAFTDSLESGAGLVLILFLVGFIMAFFSFLSLLGIVQMH